jgi:hypothetical protein
MGEQSAPKSNICEERELWLHPRVSGLLLGERNHERPWIVHQMSPRGNVHTTTL